MIHIPKAEYTRRRKALMAQMEPNSIAILPAAAVAIRNRDVEHVYRQDSDFQYLSGFPEPEAVIVLMPGRQHGEYVLFCRERNAERGKNARIHKIAGQLHQTDAQSRQHDRVEQDVREQAEESVQIARHPPARLALRVYRGLHSRLPVVCCRFSPESRACRSLRSAHDPDSADQ